MWFDYITSWLMNDDDMLMFIHSSCRETGTEGQYGTWRHVAVIQRWERVQKLLGRRDLIALHVHVGHHHSYTTPKSLIEASNLIYCVFPFLFSKPFSLPIYLFFFSNNNTHFSSINLYFNLYYCYCLIII